MLRLVQREGCYWVDKVLRTVGRERWFPRRTPQLVVMAGNSSQQLQEAVGGGA